MSSHPPVRIAIETTDPDFAVHSLSSTCEYLINCDLCGCEYQHAVDMLSEENEQAVSMTMLREGWRKVTWPGHEGIACPECVNRGTVEY